MTPAGIEPATFRFVAQQLNHCVTAVPWPGSCSVCKFCCYLRGTGSVTLCEDLAALTAFCLIIESWFHPREFPLAVVYVYRDCGNMQNGSTHWRPPTYLCLHPTLMYEIHGTSPPIPSIIVLAHRFGETKASRHRFVVARFVSVTPKK